MPLDRAGSALGMALALTRKLLRGSDRYDHAPPMFGQATSHRLGAGKRLAPPRGDFLPVDARLPQPLRCSLALADDQFQPRPDVADGAHFNVHETKGQGQFSNDIFGNVRLDLRGLLRPRDPYKTGLFQLFSKRGERLCQQRPLRREEVNGLERCGCRRRDPDPDGKFAKPGRRILAAR